jgi:hypothetical protein
MKWLTFWSESLFLGLLMVLLSVALIAIGITYFNRIKGYRFIIVYAAFSLLQGIFGSIITAYNPYNLINSSYFENSLNLFVIVEFSIFYFYLRSIAENKLVKNLMVTLIAIFYALVGYEWVVNNGFFQNPNRLTVIECYFLLIACLWYYYELFLRPPTIEILTNTDFLMVCGIFVLSAGIIPLYSIAPFLEPFFLQEELSPINYIVYCCLFLCFIKALLCQQKIVQL